MTMKDLSYYIRGHIVCTFTSQGCLEFSLESERTPKGNCVVFHQTRHPINLNMIKNLELKVIIPEKGMQWKTESVSYFY